MIRIVLPLAVIVLLLFAPLLAGEESELGGIVQANTRTGMDYVGGTLKCWTTGNFSIEGDCAPKGEGNLGLAIFAAVFVSAVAAALGVLGLFPIIGRLTSAITTLAGVVVIAGVGFYILSNIGGEHDGGVQWGSYLAGGGGLLTLIAGLSGMRGR
jgi:hypothetical protein